MSKPGYASDLSALLYLVPFALSAAYGAYLWVQAGVSEFLPSTVYLTVTRDPIVFVLGSLAVLLGAVIDERSADPASRRGKLEPVAGTLQNVAIASLVLSLGAALYANGFNNVSGAATDFIVGRFSIVFPAMLVLLSYLLTARFGFGALTNTKVIAIIALLLVPASVYEIGKRYFALGLGLAFVFLAIGVALFLSSTRKPKAVKEVTATQG